MLSELSVTVPGLSELLAGLAVMPRELEVESYNATRTATLAVEAEIKRLTPVKTGRLRSAWHSEVRALGPELIGVVGDPVSYAPVVEFGSKPHVIEPRNKQALKTPYGVFRRVNHPGTSGKHMAREGLLQATPIITAIFQKAANTVLRRARRG